MTYVSDGRVPVRQDISGFVVAEDQSLEARLRRIYQKARDSAGQMRVSGGLQGERSTFLRSAALQLGHWSTAAKTGLSSVVSQRVQRFTAVSEMLPDSRTLLIERLKDAGFLAMSVCGGLAGMFWGLSRAGKGMVLAAGVMCSLLLWPVEDAAPSSVAAPFPAAQANPASAMQATRFDVEQWKPVAAPIAAFHLEAPELDRASFRYRARMHAEGARQELLSWGSAADSSRKRATVLGAVSIEHYPKAVPESDTLYIDLVRRAALVGASVERVGAPIGLATKFGVFETADATLMADGTRRGCLAYRHLAEAVPMQIHGWFCGTAERPIDRSTLGCMLDRIDILSAGNDKALRAYFAAVERTRQPCGTARLTTAKANWMDPNGTMPALKTSFSAQ